MFVPYLQIIIKRWGWFHFMFSLIYLKSDKYGVVDNKTMRFHMLSKESFDLMVNSAKEEEVEIRGVTYTKDGYECSPVAFEHKLNMFNVLPYIEGYYEASKGCKVESIYASCFSALLSIGFGGAKVTKEELCVKIAVFAYYHMRVSPLARTEHSIVVELLNGICANYKGIDKILMKEPYPDDVMKKFRCKPINVEV